MHCLSLQIDCVVRQIGVEGEPAIEFQGSGTDDRRVRVRDDMGCFRENRRTALYNNKHNSTDFMAIVYFMAIDIVRYQPRLHSYCCDDDYLGLCQQSYCGQSTGERDSGIGNSTDCGVTATVLSQTHFSCTPVE